MTPLPQVFVSPPIDPQWFFVVCDGTSSAMGYSGESIHAAPDDVRHAAYRLAFGESSPLWRVAEPHEVSLALWSLLVQ